MLEIFDVSRGLLKEGKNEEALKFLNEFYLVEPTNVLAARMRALAYYKLEKYQEAIEILLEAVAYAPEEVNLYVDISECYFKLEDYQSGLIFVRKGLAKAPKMVELVKGHAIILKSLNRIEEAVDVLITAIGDDPNNTEYLKVLGNIYFNILSNSTKATECFDRVLNIEPNDYKTLLRLCDMLTRAVEGSEADNIARAYKIAKSMLSGAPHDSRVITSQYIFLKVLDYEGYEQLSGFRDQLKIMSDNDALLPLVLNMSRVQTMQDRWDLLEAYRQWGRKISENKRKEVVRKTRKHLGKKVRFGIVTNDVNNNHVFHFIRPIIEHLDSSKFELYIYSLFPESSDSKIHRVIKANSKRFQSYFIAKKDHEVAQDIADDSLDLLLETGVGFMKPGLTTYKPAPVQVSWLDCPHSAGLSADYIVVDPYINPGQDLLLEQPLVLDNTWVAIDENRFAPHTQSYSIPEDRNGYITFGTMNSTFKLTYESFRVWAGIMHRVPGSRFLYVRPEAVSPILQNNFCRYMEQYGISSDRISFVATRTRHLDKYHDIDIALDVFPHTGGTTTCESLWMGVPVVTLVGPCFFERLSYSNLSNAGLADLCAFNIKDYQEIAVQLANDKERRRYMKRNLRQQLIKHPLGQPQEFVKDFEKAILNVLGRSG